MAQRKGGIQASFDFGEYTDIVEKKQTVVRDMELPWIKVAKGSPYFITDKGNPWTPIGQNDAITWPELAGSFRRKDLGAVESYFKMLSRSGVTCVRLMLEYCQGEHRYLEKPAGHFMPNMIRLWDDIFDLCEKHQLRILLTPYDTFWMWRRWSHHPYFLDSKVNCNRRSQWLICPDLRALIKQRLSFATRRWGASGVLFAWDLWNEIRPAHSGNSAKGFYAFIEDISGFLRQTELAIHGRAHLQTVSVFSPVLQRDQQIAESVFRHPALDFATIHLYEKNTIDNPGNTINAAISTGRLTREVLTHIKDKRPFFDSEHGPIKSFKDRGKSLPEAFDDEYFRHMQWAHFSSGGAGGGLRWPYRHPHMLTPAMRKAQLALRLFLPLIRWDEFRRVNLNREVELTDPGLCAFACGDDRQAIVWLLRVNAVGKNKMIHKDAAANPFYASIPLLRQGRYLVTLWDTVSGFTIRSFEFSHIAPGNFNLSLPPVKTDLALAIVRYEV